MKKLLTLCLVLGLTACTPNDHNNMSHDAQAGDHQGIIISAARVVPPFPGRDISAGYFEIANHGANDRLVSISSPISPRVEMHTHLNEDGIMKMRKIDGLALKAGETTVFKPGSYHIMMFETAMSDAETDVSLTFNFETGPSMTVIADIDGRGKDGGDDHKGH